MAKSYADRARALVGTPFRVQGREAATGLDCAGLIIVTFGLPSAQFRRDYRLRGDHRLELARVIALHFRRMPRAQGRPGDLLMLSVARDQLHLAVQTDAGFVHADAGIGTVVETPGTPKWKTVAVYRRRARQRKAGV
ncbi:MAG: C40 family peptidase [Sphingomonas sp.]|nr:C40 family peptidase [Sphingomonas sp.]